MRAWAILKSSGWFRPVFPEARGEFKIELVVELTATGARWLVTLIGRSEPESLQRVLFVSSDPAAAQRAYAREVALFFGAPCPAPSTRPGQPGGAPSAHRTDGAPLDTRIKATPSGQHHNIGNAAEPVAGPTADTRDRRQAEIVA